VPMTPPTDDRDDSSNRGDIHAKILTLGRRGAHHTPRAISETPAAISHQNARSYPRSDQSCADPRSGRARASGMARQSRIGSSGSKRCSACGSVSRSCRSTR
jgi:hypothetical protein